MSWLAGRLFTRAALTRLAVIAVMLAIWEIAARGFVDPLFLAPPSKVVAGLGTVFATNGVPAAVGITLVELVVAFALSVAIGLIVGLTLGLFDFPRRSFMPMVLLLYGIPQAIMLQLFVLIFGIGPAVKIAFGFSHGIFPVIVNTLAGMRNVNRLMVTGAAAMGATRIQQVRYVIFPHMIPVFFTGMRLGMTGVLLGVLLAELYVSTAGIGYFTTLFTQNFDPVKLLGLVGTLAAMAIVLNTIMRRLEMRFARWRD